MGVRRWARDHRREQLFTVVQIQNRLSIRNFVGVGIHFLGNSRGLVVSSNLYASDFQANQDYVGPIIAIESLSDFSNLPLSSLAVQCIYRTRQKLRTVEANYTYLQTLFTPFKF